MRPEVEVDFRRSFDLKTNKLAQRRRWTFGVSTRPVISDLQGVILRRFETNKVAVTATGRLQGSFIAGSQRDSQA